MNDPAEETRSFMGCSPKRVSERIVDERRWLIYDGRFMFPISEIQSVDHVYYGHDDLSMIRLKPDRTGLIAPIYTDTLPPDLRPDPAQHQESL